MAGARKVCLGEGLTQFRSEWLNTVSRERAVRHVVNSSDRVIIDPRCGRRRQDHDDAGSGRSHSERAEESVRLRSVGRRQPGRAEAGRVRDADTVARLLVDEKLQQKINGQVIWIDEAGLIGTKTMAQVFDLAGRLDARVLLSGDRRQHGSVEHGAALRLSKTRPVPSRRNREIQRQKGEYKQAVQSLSEGRVEEGFDRLDELGWIKEIPETERYRQLAADHITALENGDMPLLSRRPTSKSIESTRD